MGHEAASVRAKQNVWREGLIVHCLACGEPTGMVAAKFNIPLDQLAEIAAEWTTDGPAREYLDRQFSLHVACGSRCMPPPSLEQLAEREAQRIRAACAHAAKQAEIRVARDRVKERRASLGISLAERNAQMVGLRREGLTLSEIATRYFISRGRVADIIARERRRESRHLKKRRGRPLDMGGPRDVWINYDLVDDQA